MLVPVKNLFYIVRNDKSNKNDIGFFKKFYGQISVFQQHCNVYFVFFKDNCLMVEFFEKGSAANPVMFKLKKYRFKLTAYLFSYIRIILFIRHHPVDILYYRYKFSEPFFLLFLLYLKKKINKLLIFLEFPTFPYDEIWKKERLLKKVLLPVDKFFRRFLKRYVDYAVTYTSGNVYNLKTLYIQNGLSVLDIPPKKFKKFNENNVKLIGVAGLGFWHGFDRVIKGIYLYLQNTNANVVFNIVGEGKEKNNLIKLTNELNLNNNIVFTGAMQGKELDVLFDESDIAISTLGSHRIGITKLSALKSREYCARGIPFIYEGNNDGFDDDFPYILRVDSNDEPVNIEVVINFYRNILKGYTEKMRNYAKNNFSWDKQMMQIIDIICK